MHRRMRPGAGKGLLKSVENGAANNSGFSVTAICQTAPLCSLPRQPLLLPRQDYEFFNDPGGMRLCADQN